MRSRRIAHAAALFDWKFRAIYPHPIGNPTIDRRYASPRRGGPRCSVVGQAAETVILNLAGAGDHIVFRLRLYGGSTWPTPLHYLLLARGQLRRSHSTDLDTLAGGVPA